MNFIELMSFSNIGLSEIFDNDILSRFRECDKAMSFIHALESAKFASIDPLHGDSNKNPCILLPKVLIHVKNEDFSMAWTTLQMLLSSTSPLLTWDLALSAVRTFAVNQNVSSVQSGISSSKDLSKEAFRLLISKFPK